MRYRYARKLHNADEVTHKYTGRVCRVVTATVGKKIVKLDVIHPTLGFQTMTHRDVR